MIGKFFLLDFFRFLATGDSYTTIAASFRTHKSTICKIVLETCDAIWRNLQPKALPTPTAESWKEIAKDFYHFWQFPNCVGARDGKHIIIQALALSGSLYRVTKKKTGPNSNYSKYTGPVFFGSPYNYKNTHSIVLLAVADAQCKFVHVDVGACGRQSDGSVFSNSSLNQSLLSNTINLPPPSNLPNTELTLPYVFVGNEAFPLTPNLMRPFPGRNLSHDKRIFNYRLSRARRIVENTFGILSTKWRIFRPRLESLRKKWSKPHAVCIIT